jgi:hypothetical protein
MNARKQFLKEIKKEGVFFDLFDLVVYLTVTMVSLLQRIRNSDAPKAEIKANMATGNSGIGMPDSSNQKLLPVLVAPQTVAISVL